MTNKQNDWLATLLYQPNLSIEDLNSLGITPDNTELKSRDDYKSLSAIQDAFKTDSGNFDEKAFNNFYDSALLAYNQYADESAAGNIADNYKFDPFDWRYDKTAKDVRATVTLDKNPMGYSIGTKSINEITDPIYSVREIAQTNRVFNYETGEFEDWTPNDKGGLFKSLFRPSLVLATYDKDEDVEENGRLVHHSKGEYKYDPITGKPYYETIGDREIYDKDVLHYSDTLTKEGTTINNYDFFDSDGLDKSVGGTVMKLTASLVPMGFALATPAIGWIYGGVSAAIALSQLVPTLGKAINGFITNDNQNEIGKNLSTLEAYTARFGKSVSDRSREKMVTFENAGGLIKDVAMQLFQQRAVQYIPRLFKNNPKIYNNSELAKTLSYAYMSGTSALESYSAFKQAGADDRVAGLGMFATIGAFYKLMSIDYFRDSFFRGSWFDDNNVKSPLWDVASDFMAAIKKDGTEIAKDVAENTVKSNSRTLKSLTKAITGAIQRTGQAWRPMTFFERTFAEGTEEVMEEAFQDAIKGSFKAAEALGIPMNNEETKLDFGFSGQDVLQRYGMSFFGGLVGGAVFQGYNNLELGIRNRGIDAVTKLPQHHLSELVKLISDGRTDEIKRTLAKWHRLQRFGTNNLSATKLNITTGIDGDTVTAEAKTGNELSQNDFIYQTLLDEVDYVNKVLEDEGFKNFESLRIKALEDKGITDYNTDQIKMEDLNLHTLIYQDIVRLAERIVEYNGKIDSRKSSLKVAGDTADAKAETEKRYKEDGEIKEWENRLKELRRLRDDIKDGKWDDYYVSQYQLMINSTPLTPFLGFSDKESYIRARFGKNATELTQDQLTIATSEYEAYKNGQDKTIFEAIDTYRAFSQEFAKDIEKTEQRIGDSIVDEDLETSVIGNLYFKNLKEREKAQERIKVLKEKETLTEDETKELAKLEEDVLRLDKEINSARRSPSRMMFNVTTKKDALIERMQQALNDPEIGVESLADLADEILNYYQDLKTRKVLKRSEPELESFYTLLNRIFTKESRRDSFDTWLSDLANYPINGVSSEFSDYRGGYEFNSIQQDILNTIDSIFDNLKVGRENDALKAYNDLRAKLSNLGLKESDIEEFLEANLPHIGDRAINDFLNDIISAKTGIKTSILPELIESLKYRINDDVLSNIFDMLQSERARLESQSTLDSYVMSDRVYESLKSAYLLLNALKGIVTGASDGTNAKINQYKDVDKFAEISPNAGLMINDEIDEYLNRISFLLALNDKNKGLKLREHKEIAVNMHLKFLDKLTSALHSEPFKQAFRKDDLDEVDPAAIWESRKPANWDSISPENFDLFEPEIIAFETELFERVKALDFTQGEIISKIMSLFGNESRIWTRESTKVSSDSDVIVSDYDFANYLLTILTLNSNDFYTKLRDIVSEKFEKSPLYGHEYVARTFYAYMLNPTAFNQLSQEIALKYTGTDTYISEKPTIDNILFGFGSAGTGKSTSIAAVIKEMVSDLDASIVYLASGKDQIQNLLKSVDAKSDEVSLSYSELFDKLGDNLFADEKLEKTENNRIKFKTNPILNSVSLHDDTKSIKIIIADEIETLNELQLQVLSQWASENNIVILGLGDYKQPTGKLKFEGSSYASGIEDCNVIKTPTLRTSLRTLSVAKNDNALLLDTLVEEVTAKSISDPENYLESTKQDELIKSLIDKGIDLKYYDIEGRIVGDQILKDEKVFKQNIDRAIATGEKVLIVYDKSTISKYQSDKYSASNITKMSSDEALGGEFDYVFVDIPISNSDTKNLLPKLQEFYMLTQRSRLYTTVLDTNDWYSTNLKISSKHDPLSGGLMQLDGPQIKDFKEWRLKCLESLNYSPDYETNLSKKTVEKPLSSTGEPKKVESVESKVVEKPKNISETPTAEKTVEKITDTSTEEKPEVFEELSSSENEVESTEDKVENLEPSIENSEPNPELPTSLKKRAEKVKFKLESEKNETTDIHNKFNETPKETKEFITSVDNSGNFTAGSFYQTVNTEQWLRLEQSNQNSLWNVLKQCGVRNLGGNTYRDWVIDLSMRILESKSTADAKNKVKSQLENVIIRSKNEAFERFFTGPVNIRFVQNGSNSDIVFELQDLKTGDVLQLKIGEYNKPISGTYTGWFNKINGPQFKKGERITLTELKKRYPGLNFMSKAGIFIGPRASGIDEDFIERNDGKTFVAVGEIVNGLTPEQVFITANSNGNIWAYDHSDTVSLIGIQKTLSPKEVLEFLKLQNYMKVKYADLFMDDREKRKNTQNFKKSNLPELEKELISLGFVVDGKVNDSKVISRLVEISGDNRWESITGNITRNDATALLYESYIATSGTMGIVLSTVLNIILSNPTLFKNSTMWSSLRRDLSRTSEDRRLYFQTKNGELFYITSNTVNNKLHWSIYDDSNRIIGTVYPGDKTGSELAIVLKELINLAGIDLSTSKALIFNKKETNDGTVYWNVHNTNQTFLEMLEPIQNNTELLNKIFSQFKYGFFANISSKEDPRQHSAWKLVSLVENLDKYTTDASIWEYSSYNIDEDQIEGNISQQELDLINQAKEWKERIVNDASKLISKNVVEEVLHNHRNQYTIGSEMLADLQKIIDEINEQILARTTNQNTNILELDSGTEGTRVVSYDSRQEAITNVLQQNGFTTESTIIQGKDNLMVANDGRSSAFVWIGDNGNVIVSKTSVGQDYLEAIQSISNIFQLEGALDDKLAKARNQQKLRMIQVLETYMSDFVKNSVTVDEFNNMWKLIENNSDAVTILNDFIEKRLNSEIDEC